MRNFALGMLKPQGASGSSASKPRDLTSAAHTLPRAAAGMRGSSALRQAEAGTVQPPERTGVSSFHAR